MRIFMGVFLLFAVYTIRFEKASLDKSSGVFRDYLRVVGEVSFSCTKGSGEYQSIRT